MRIDVKFHDMETEDGAVESYFDSVSLRFDGTKESELAEHLWQLIRIVASDPTTVLEHLNTCLIDTDSLRCTQKTLCDYESIVDYIKENIAKSQ